MTKKELIEKLKDFSDDWKVFIDYDDMIRQDCQAEVIGVYCIDEGEIGLNLE